MMKADKKPSQRKIADELGISVGKVNKFIKEIKKELDIMKKWKVGQLFQ